MGGFSKSQGASRGFQWFPREEEEAEEEEEDEEAGSSCTLRVYGVRFRVYGPPPPLGRSDADQLLRHRPANEDER